MGRQQSPGQEHWLLSLPGYLPGAKGLVVKGGKAFVPSENLQVRGCEVWTENGGTGRASEKKQASPDKQAPSQQCSAAAKVFTGSVPRSKEVSGWICTPG